MSVIEDKLDWNSCKQTFLEITSLLEEQEIPFRLAYGTLLGAIRDKDFIVGDTDIDFLVDYAWKKEVNSLIDYFEVKGFKVVRDWDSILTFENRGNTIDLYFFRKRNVIDFLLNRVTIKQGWWGAFLDCKYYYNWQKILFCGKTFYTIGYPTLWLCKMYGQDWFIPQNKKGNSRLWSTNFIMKHKSLFGLVKRGIRKVLK